MKTFTDDEMNERLPAAKPYSVVILKAGPNSRDDKSSAIAWEHIRRTLGLRDDGVVAVMLLVTDASEIYGIRVFDATVEDTTALMNDDPGVAAGVFAFEVHPCRGFPGDTLP
jgi:hypothetical protein